MADVAYTLGLLLLTVAVASVAADWCQTDDDLWLNTWCLRGCCGITKNECCPELELYDDYYELSGGAIAGFVILSIVALAMVVGGVILVIYFCTTCFRQITTPPGVVYANGVANPAVVASTSVNMASHPTHQSTVSHTTYQHPQTVAFNKGFM
ncbi:uncharacterized protein LOC110456723 [Mizuhopecten yessoensis]|uniref:uncharacterized protein LOC110456723 n=1 Tax=Mizuhopecten yessoensis TaxID=6573 RepID=UPI000B45E971|nr:uncharacterized protein LOC110456723 [Mizuhopecten yessoensis]